MRVLVFLGNVQYKYIAITLYFLSPFSALAFFNHINVQVGAITALCTAQTCPTMTAGKE